MNWVAGWLDNSGSFEYPSEGNWTDARAHVLDLLHYNRFSVRRVSELDGYDRATSVLENATEGTPVEALVDGRRYYVRASFVEPPASADGQYVGRHARRTPATGEGVGR